MAFGFDKLIDPIAPDTFRDIYYEKQPLLIKRQIPSYYNDIVTIEAISDHLGQANITYPGIRLVKDGKELDSKEFTYSITTTTGTTDGVANKEKVFVHFYAGHTLILNSYDRHSHGAAQVRHLAERTFSAVAQANVYITPNASQGFKPHWDNHDVFVLQFQGTKRWRVYDSPTILPSKRQQFADGDWTRVEPTLEALLEPGDLLYLPRGFVHEASSADAVSGHVTLGITTYTYADVALRLLNVIDEDAWFRHSLPSEFKSGVDVELFVNHLRRFVSGVDVESALVRLYAEFVSSRLPDSSDRLLDYIKLRSVDDGTRLKKKSHVIYDIEHDDTHVLLRFNNKTVRFPIVAKECLQSIMDLPSFIVGDLHGDIDVPSKLLVCKKLVEEGFLSVIA